MTPLMTAYVMANFSFAMKKRGTKLENYSQSRSSLPSCGFRIPVCVMSSEFTHEVRVVVKFQPAQFS